MYLDAAAAAVSAGQLEKASQALDKADEWLDQTSATFKASLTQNRDDVVASLSLAATGVKYVNDTTVTVKLSKPASVLLAADDFHFTNGLEVTAIGQYLLIEKTVTLTTTKQKDGETYATILQRCSNWINIYKSSNSR